MKKQFLFISIFFSLLAHAQDKAENIIIITTDGFRWQEIFTGMDSAIANDKRFNQDDSTFIFQHYWNNDPVLRRKNLMPFLWNKFFDLGQIHGNRLLGNKVDNANPYWFSYPGYSEIMTGFVDTAINSNGYKPNPNTNVLEFLNQQPKLKGKVAAFGAWDAFDRIFNEKRSGFPVTSAFDSIGDKHPSANEKLMTAMNNDAYKPFGDEECLDVFTHYAAMEYLKTKKPRVLYIAYGETDEWAHSGHYRDYLNAAHQIDKWIEELWKYLQSDPQYKDKTTILFTTDHGRGDIIKSEWTSHNNKIQDSYQIWFAAMGPGVAIKGEVKENAQLYQKQLAQTIAHILGYTFTAEHPVAEGIKLGSK
jgi:hypothetical protein